VIGEVVSPAAELAAAFVATLAARPQTQETYRRACRRFVAWLGPDAGPMDLTLASVSAYQRELDGRDPPLSPTTVRKDRAAINSFLRFCVDSVSSTRARASSRWRSGCPRAAVAVGRSPKR